MKSCQKTHSIPLGSSEDLPLPAKEILRKKSETTLALFEAEDEFFVGAIIKSRQVKPTEENSQKTRNQDNVGNYMNYAKKKKT